MKRRIVTITIFLLFGVVINVAVAWGCVLWLPKDDIVTLFEKEVRQRIPPDVTVRSDLFFFNGLEIKPPGRSILMLAATEVDDGVDSAVPLYWELHAGWPTMSLDGTYKMTETGGHYPFLFYLPEWLWERVEFFLVPWRPQWPGFAINTMLYGGVPWLLVCGPFEFRRYRRRKRGLCVYCAYPIGTSDVCTECGRPVARPVKPGD
ncbi:MAG: hypothetical protein V3T53_13495 [Phycisphaerales bacterium]